MQTVFLEKKKQTKVEEGIQRSLTALRFDTVTESTIPIFCTKMKMNVFIKCLLMIFSIMLKFLCKVCGLVYLIDEEHDSGYVRADSNYNKHDKKKLTKKH